MKKVLATVAALGLVLGVTANALALDQPGKAAATEADTAPRVPVPTAPGVALWSVAGQWVLAGAYLSNGYGSPGDANVNTEGSNDDFYIYSFKILPVLQVNDKISMKGEIRFSDRDVFGLTDNTFLNSYTEKGGRAIDMYQLYMEWTSPWGKTRFGRTPGGAWAGDFMNSGAQANRLMWWPNVLPKDWGMLVFTEKRAERDAGGNTILSSDNDADGYYVDLSYKADFGKTIGAFWIVRDGSVRDSTGDHLITTQFRLYGNYTFGALGLEYELNYDFGDGPSETGTTFSSRQAVGFELDGSYKVQDWTLGGLFFIMTGDDDITDNDSNAMFSTSGSSSGVGKDYNPYQIMTGDYMGLLNGDNPLAGNGVNSAFGSGGISSGVWSLGGYVKYALSPELSLGGEVGYFAATDELTGWDDDMGWEFGVGMGYKIMDNLMYNAHFSYLATGDFFKQGQASGTTEDVYLLAHALSMKF